MEKLSRRSFTQSLLGSFFTFSLAERLTKAEALCGPVKPLVTRWLAELEEVSKALKSGKVKGLEWQQKVDDLFHHIEFPDFIRAIDFDRLARKIKFQENHEAIFEIERVDGSKVTLTGAAMLEGLRKGVAIVPHGHINMVSFHMVLKGDLHTRCYDRVETDARNITIKPTIDKVFGPGELATMSDDKDNVHWFKAVSETVFAFNVGVYEVNPSVKWIGREYIDPERGEKLGGGLIRAPRISDPKEAYRLYGKS